MVVAVVALVVFGPEKLPEMARSIGRAMAEFRRVVDDAKDELQAGFNVDDEPGDEPAARHPMREALYGPYAEPEPVSPPDPPAPTRADSSPPSEPVPGLDTDVVAGSEGGSMIPIPEAPARHHAGEESDDI